MLCCLCGRSKDSNQFSTSTMQTKITKLGLVRLGEANKTLSGVWGTHGTHSYCGAGSLLINCQAHCFLKVFSQSEILRLLAEIFTVRPAFLSSNWKVMTLQTPTCPPPHRVLPVFVHLSVLLHAVPMEARRKLHIPWN